MKTKFKKTLSVLWSIVLILSWICLVGNAIVMVSNIFCVESPQFFHSMIWDTSMGIFALVWLFHYHWKAVKNTKRPKLVFVISLISAFILMVGIVIVVMLYKTPINSMLSNNVFTGNICVQWDKMPLLVATAIAAVIAIPVLMLIKRKKHTSILQ